MRASKVMSLLLIATLVVLLSGGIAQAQQNYEINVSGYLYYLYLWSYNGFSQFPVKLQMRAGSNDYDLCTTRTDDSAFFSFTCTLDEAPKEGDEIYLVASQGSYYWEQRLFWYDSWGVQHSSFKNGEAFYFPGPSDWMREGTWLLVHGSDGNPGNWDKVKGVMEGSPYNIDNIKVVDLEQYNHDRLEQWADNLVDWMDKNDMLEDSVPDGSIKVVAHSFGGAVTLFILRVAYELEYGDAEQLGNYIADVCGSIGSLLPEAKEACGYIATKLKTIDTSSGLGRKYIEAAKKIGGVYLYHPTLLGGCQSCALSAGNWDWASICALGTADQKLGYKLWTPIRAIERGGYTRIVNLYGYGEYNYDTATECNILLGGCLASEPPHDGHVRLEHQRLWIDDTFIYNEIFGGYACHGDFQVDDDVASALVEKILQCPTPHPNGIGLHDVVCDNEGHNASTDRCCLVTGDVMVPLGETLTMLPGTEVYFESGCKITADGTLNATGELDNPVELFSAAAPDCRMKLMCGMILKNGAEFKPGQ
jgi:hypothetical protein